MAFAAGLNPACKVNCRKNFIPTYPECTSGKNATGKYEC